MLILVKRRTYTPQSTQGEMFLNNVHECWTLEPRADQSQGKPYCVPDGIYDWEVAFSPRFNRNVIRVQSLPGFDDIEVHPGNFPRDTHGCCLVGSTESANFVGHSDAEFDALLAKLPPSGQIQYLNSEDETWA
jgi:hypothetical protein